MEDAAHNLYVVGAWREQLAYGHRAWLTGRTDAMEPASLPVYGHPEGPRLLWPRTLLPEGWLALPGPAYPAARAISALHIEATQHQSTFVGELLAHTRLPALPVYPDTDKVPRARPLAARMEAGKVSFLRGGPGLGSGPDDPGELPRELLAFPNAEHDDLVDAAVYAADLGGVEFYFTAGRR